MGFPEVFFLSRSRDADRSLAPHRSIPIYTSLLEDFVARAVEFEETFVYKASRQDLPSDLLRSQWLRSRNGLESTNPEEVTEKVLAVELSFTRTLYEVVNLQMVIFSKTLIHIPDTTRLGLPSMPTSMPTH